MCSGRFLWFFVNLQPLIPGVSDEHMFLFPFHLLTWVDCWHTQVNTYTTMAAWNMTSTMQEPNRRTQTKNSLQRTIQNPSSLFCCIKNSQIGLSVLSEIMADRTVVAAEPNMFWWVLFEKTKSNLADTDSLQQHNRWSQNWMCHMLFTWISLFNIILFSGIQCSVQI